ncbi:response regulator [Flavobacterium sp.]|uniref:response regulator n=1 Tax=Flavobacterium sp. TaxID=239 RepID=UPI0025E20E55|nr:response regulator [Flavobacterium sp.]
MTQTQTNPRNIFLVDDDAEDRELFSEALSQVDESARLTEISSCFTLMETLDNPEIPKPDIIFLDMDMPKFSGLECLKKLKASNKIQNLKIVVLSTYSHPQYVDEAYKNGASCYYVKPSRFPKLKEVISDALQGNWKKRIKNKRNFVVNYSGS